jgi:alpha-galactosidase
MSGAKAKIYFADLVIEARDLAHRIWRQAEAVPITKYWSGTDAEVGRHAEVRLLYTSGALLFRFECEQSEPLIINDKLFLTQKTIGLWEKDVCEAFIAPNPELPERYFEFEAAPTGEWLDLKIHQMEGKREVDWAYASGMKCAAEIGSDRVIIAMQIPWEAFGRKPEAGELWRGNLFRCVGSGESRGYLAWQPTGTPEPNFHVPSAFGWFEFVK